MTAEILRQAAASLSGEAPARAKRAVHAGWRLTALLVCTLLTLSGGYLAALSLDRSRLLDAAEKRYGERGARAANAWLAIIDDSRNLTDTERLERINRFFNTRIAFTDDNVAWGQPDYWATPLETLGITQGDCEDFAIAKYVTLRLAGVDEDRLRLIYVRARLQMGGSEVMQAHMVLGYYPTPNSTPLILDNLVAGIERATERGDLTPVYAFNGAGIWLGGRRAPAANDPVARLSRWRDVLNRMQAEGIGS